MSDELRRSVLSQIAAQELVFDIEPAEEVSDAQKHWDESLEQLHNAVFFALLPVIGRILGRRFARSMWMRYVNWRWRTRAASD